MRAEKARRGREDSPVDEVTSDDLDAHVEDAPHLSRTERRQAADSVPIGPLVIHEVVREQGEAELSRSLGGLAWSGLAAGLSMGFSVTVQAALQAGIPDAPWRPLVASFGYCMGFLIVVLGRQQLFTETTLTALIPVLTRRTVPTLLKMLRVWGIVLAANLTGTLMISALMARSGIFRPEMAAAVDALAQQTVAGSFGNHLLGAGFAGWLIGLMIWLLPGAGPSRPMIIILLTYAIAVCQFPHIVAGSVETSYAMFTGHLSVGDYLLHFVAPTLIGNSIGGSVLAALLNHAPVADELGERVRR